MGARRKSREMALQILYLLELNKGDVRESLETFQKLHVTKEDIWSYACELVRGTIAHIEELDGMISSYAENWDLNRMAAVDRNLLRMAAYEMLFHKGTPPVVVINEAIDIAKKYSTPQSGSFVNGMLDRIRKDRVPDSDGKSS